MKFQYKPSSFFIISVQSPVSYTHLVKTECGQFEGRDGAFQQFYADRTKTGDGPDLSLIHIFFNAVKNKHISIKRIPGIRRIRKNDILIVNSPVGQYKNRIHFDVMQYYAKRCVGLPGDTCLLYTSVSPLVNAEDTRGPRSRPITVAPIRQICGFSSLNRFTKMEVWGSEV